MEVLFLTIFFLRKRFNCSDLTAVKLKGRDSSHGRTMDPDMFHSSSLGLSPWSQLPAKATQIGMAPATMWPLNSNTAPGLGPDL